MESSIARVYLLDVPFHVDKPYDYNIPPELRGAVNVGSFVCVPFGGGNRKQLALVGELDCVAEHDKLKPIFSVVCDCITLNAEQLGLIMYMKEYTFCTTGDAVGALLPPSILTKMKEYYSLADPDAKLPSSLTKEQELVYHFLSSYGKVTEQKLTRGLGQWSVDIVKSFCKNGIAIKETEFSEFSNIKTVEYASLAVSIDEAETIAGSIRAPKQAELLRLLITDGTKEVGELKNEYKFSSAQIKAVEKRGAIKLEKHEIFRDPYASESFKMKREPLRLSKEQTRAKDEICSYLKKKEAQAVLLRGITGSGKTSVIKAVMDEVIESGKGVIMLVPEIALTPQTVSIFRSYYGDKAVVVHSQLSAGERYDVWKKISSGEALICIGTRSAVFAPFKNLGLIVVDEEQEHTYKSDMNPKYHAIDIARYRCAKHGALMLLASATPSLTSQFRASEERYHEVVLGERFGDAVLPEGIIADLREDSANGIVSPIGSRLRHELAETMKRGEQAILFVNRRGYNNFVSCPICGNVLMCPHCSVSYTYHTRRSYGRNKPGYLLCHYCGTREELPEKCSVCGNEHLRFNGYGTQKVEEELKELFPEARILRMDADTTSSKFSHDEILRSFRDGEADILLGTQMVTKGHDFPNVTLVGVLNADSSLFVDNYRAFERTFTLITQVVGRAGRGDKPGKALIQTYNPEHPILHLAASQDYEAFYKSESALRKSLVFPPYCDIVLISLTASAENELDTATEILASMLAKLRESDFPDIALVVFGPIEAPLYKINETYKKNFIIKCKFNARTRLLMRTLITMFEKKIGKKISLSIDVNPNSI